DIPGVALPPDLGLGGRGDLADQLEVVAPEPAVLDVAERPQCLVAPVVILPVAVAATNDEADQVFESRGAAIGRLRSIRAKLAGTQFEKRSIAEAGVPLELSDPAPGQAAGRRVVRLVDGRASGQLTSGRAERLEPERLAVTAGLAEADHGVARRRSIRGLARVVGQVCPKWLDGEVHLPRGDLLIAERGVPPERVRLDVSPDVDVDVVIALQPVRIARRHPDTTGGASPHLIVVDVERLPLPVFVVGVQRAVVLVAPGLTDELHPHAWGVPLRSMRARADRDFLERS